MKKDVFVEDYNDEMTDESEIALEDLVDEDDVIEDAYVQHLIDQEEERALIEDSEEEALIDAAEEDRLIAEGETQAMIDAYIEKQYVEQCLSEQEDEEVLIEQMQQLDDDVDVIDTIPNDPQPIQNIAVVEEDDDEEEENDDAPINEAAHRQVLLLMRQHNHLDIYVKKEEISISCFGITRLKYKLNDNGWQWILNYLETGCYEDYGVDPLKVADNDCESRVKELIERGSNIARVPFLRETEAYIEICAFYRYGKLYFSIRRNDDFMNYLIEKGL